MEGYKFFDENGTFTLKDPDLYSYLYFPVGATSSMMGCVTPELGGDLKTSQNTFILEPVSSDNLHNNRSTRNFWLYLEDGTLISATGASASAHAKKFTPGKDEVTLYGGLLWQQVKRKISGTDIETEITTFVPVNTSDRIELAGIKFQEDVRKGYLELAKASDGRIVTVDASRGVVEIFEDIKETLKGKI